ncbi:MAG: histidine phosphatase family protein [Gammaproteobacteria bacterium]
MRRLTLLRHAKSSWEDPDLDDFDRPLNARGLRNLPDMGRRLAARQDLPDLIVTSPAARALATARGIAREIGYREDGIAEAEELYLADVRQILAVVRALPDARTHAMLVGHNPGFTDFANRLEGVRIDNMPTAAMLCVDFPVSRWSAVDPATCKFVYFDYPKKQPG